MLALILPNLTISPKQSRLMVKYSLSRSNLQMTLMDSKFWFRSTFRLTYCPTASSILNQRHTMAITLFITLSLKIQAYSICGRPDSLQCPGALCRHAHHSHLEGDDKRLGIYPPLRGLYIASIDLFNSAHPDVSLRLPYFTINRKRIFC